MCHVLLGCGLGVVIGELRRVCSLAAGASACTPCTAGSYSASTGARPHLCVRESAVPPAVCTWVCVLFMCASSCFAGKHQAECDATRDRGRKFSQQVITVQMSWMWLSECLVSTPPSHKHAFIGAGGCGARSVIFGPRPRSLLQQRVRRVPRRDIRWLCRSVAVQARAEVHLWQTRVSCCEWIAASTRVTPI